MPIARSLPITHRLCGPHHFARAGLLVIAAAQAEVGLWGEISPHGFFTGFPGAGRHWLAGMGPYNEHLVRDYAAAELGLAVLLVLAAVWFDRRVVPVAAAAFFAATVPHFAYHLTTTDQLPTVDDIASLGSFVLELAIVAAAAVAVHRTGSP